jgi:hypothetical protein
LSCSSCSIVVVVVLVVIVVIVVLVVVGGRELSLRNLKNMRMIFTSNSSQLDRIFGESDLLRGCVVF